MIKRTIGIIGTLGVVAIVTFTILGREHYCSAITFDRHTPTEEIVPESPTADVTTPATIVDSITINKPLTE